MPTKKNQYSPSVIFHPGETLSEKLEEIQMGHKEFAIRTGKPEKTITAILKGKSSITPEMAVMFENVLKIPARFWLNLQQAYNEYKARVEHEKLLAESVEWAKKFPIADMVRKGWIASKRTWPEKANALLSFFSLSSPLAWENFYLKQHLKIAFRISLAHANQPYAISAWLRHGELKAAELKTIEYSEKKFKEGLPKIKHLMTEHPTDFFSQLQNICLEAGVKVIYTPNLPKAPINGATRWINGVPLIQLSGRYKRNDIFWFTFFHETAHIILHKKKDVFLESTEYSENDKEKENEADDFAIKWTLSKEEEDEITQVGSITETDIILYAKKFKTHPAIIVGRLQHKKLKPFSFGRRFIKPVELS